MTRTDLASLAQQAGLNWHNYWTADCENQLEHFAELVAAAEREACAQLCDEVERANLYGVKECAVNIKARGKSE